MNDNNKDLLLFELGRPGLEREHLVAAALKGSKTVTTSLLSEWAAHNEPLPWVGEHRFMVDSANKPVAIVEITKVDIKEISNVDDVTAQAEGEGFQDAVEWRKAHEQFWLGNSYAAGTEGWQIDDLEKIVIEEFKIRRVC